ncbi:helix-turn-helix domain-containing protein [Streptomyces sp. NPDC088253]|uniref:helix-turn-helix domain-containing protein n=1 Tax=Streptomyces sp. NPDC088253 TaxID=3365846 RepID=UPI0037F36B91
MLDDIRTAAQRLHLYARTVRYRLTKIERSVGINLADPDVRLALALSSRHSAPPAPPAPYDLALDVGEHRPLGEKHP